MTDRILIAHDAEAPAPPAAGQRRALKHPATSP